MNKTVIAVITIAIAGLLNIDYPFNGDQALFTIGAKLLADGGVLYRDFWDLKQPGIYWFYHVAGAVFGYTEIGIHLAEWLWFILLALLISISMRNRFRLPWMSDVCAIFTVGIYFAVCGSWHLSQLEGLVSLPLFGCLLLLMPMQPSRSATAGRIIAFGMMVGVIALFKLMLVTIPLLFLLIWVFPGGGKELGRVGFELFRRSMFTAIGFAAVMVPVICYFAVEHQLLMIDRTFFVYPPRIVAELPMNKLIVLLRGLRWFLVAAGPLILLGLVGLYAQVRNKPDKFTLAVIAWVFAAAFLVLIQHMWWEYHFLLILFPLGILATMGLDYLIFRVGNRIPSAPAILLILAIFPYAWRCVHKAIDQLRYRGATNFRTHISPEYANAAAESRWLSTQPAGDIYVLGDPQINFLSSRRQTVVINGWSPEFLLPEQWRELASDIADKQPHFIFIAADDQAVIDHRGQPVQQLMSEKYVAVQNDGLGVWYSSKAAK